ncbi:16S rRNA pseudouridine(516) synthase [Pseudomonas sp. S 311-6]|uniref:pseudouridine synthase n=1 Tax=Pseudomonas TaxID=286 RepID=UPI001CE4337F|nr:MULTISPECIES: 16S rRNA pseudouridine(516) synthase [Pseudomonas]MCO7635465.1 16S rRNA pseudouridine(516) synthase [Pseudomonas sp. S 311-6]MCO7566309.1 16S rRNA pseudouridine(516) synthase [Pseudomonas mosselii]MCO7595234.1 16S rRNA pseudouridine(516) synthase [Pseudomonas guariconensis]MCO7617375.1 16S rRNA pseudouridine(516) synthase [Pseudomonas guariconensis]MCO7631633.1 16S rRNA pseudouridine(516) synthase [Pseudomonas guariconensis]
MRLDRFLANHPCYNRQQVRLLLVQRRVRVGDAVVSDPRHEVRAFDRIEVDGQVLQAGHPARYLMLHKPAGYVSATQDPRHRTVLDLLPAGLRGDLHIAGRLDYNTTGLMILTNDGQWSRRLTQPGTKLPKVYHVQTEDEIGKHYVAKFHEGFYFAFENLTTQPARLDILGPRQARLAIVEGRYHQVKRMFGHFQNKVVGLHRECMGPIQLDPALAPGEFRELTEQEIASV